MLYIKSIPILAAGRTLSLLEKRSNNPWLHFMIVLEEHRTQKFQEIIEEQDS